ncbi:hypothetical protein QWY85_12930 [Neolewinella lacunae]|uniref:DUF4397 domain-containing protein n=1 Tax=Neolewinella lacunae TaxID=1517758 RepID=A0A923T970_9BACT|nr:hypothetical protein [Neolewinella lacunae]MBC6995261.1 hypothetical protein [Neolewinella lacunae]MDN3635570.1 hypothetical protein [Neolewinella lacunae]
MRIALLCFFIPILCTCGRAPLTTEMATVVGTVRYEEPRRLLTTAFNITPADSLENAPVPTLFASPLARQPLAGPGRFQDRRTVAAPDSLRGTLPLPGNPQHPFAVAFPAVAIDSLPARHQRSAPLVFPVGKRALSEQESLVLFFEPNDHGTPHRIQLLGPTSSPTLSVPAKTLETVPAGVYQVYLVRQGLHKDSTALLRLSVQTEFFTRSAPLELWD